MSDVTRILSAIERGDPHASEQLFHDLTPRQAEIMCQRVRPYLAYLRRGQLWMNRRQFPPKDELPQAVNRVYGTAPRLSVLPALFLQDAVHP